MDSTKTPRLSIVMPTLNEAAGVGDLLAALQPLRHRGHELIVVDGGSTDDTTALARRFADAVLHAPRGRATQMNAGAIFLMWRLRWRYWRGESAARLAEACR